MTFQCSICGEESTRICVRCTKDTCPNHLCDKCLRCSDCCECEVALTSSARPFTPVSQALRSARPEPEPDFEPEPIPDPAPRPEPPMPPGPDPDPFPA